MANKGSWLATGAYLGVNDYLVSDNGNFFAIMQGDGNLVSYQGSGPSNQGTPHWASNTDFGPGQYFAFMQSDGNFCIYRGSDPTHQGAFVWNSGTAREQGQYFAVLFDNGYIIIYQGTLVWASSLLYGPTGSIAVLCHHAVRWHY
jgi:hypothetical protein